MSHKLNFRSLFCIINKFKRNKYNAFEMAVKNNNINKVKNLLNQGFHPDDGLSILSFTKKNHTMLKLLIENGGFLPKHRLEQFDPRTKDFFVKLSKKHKFGFNAHHH